MVEGVEASMLESFDIGTLGQRGIQILADAIPSMKIRKLVVRVDSNDFDSEDFTSL